MTIGICIPSRALIHSRTMQDIIANTLDFDVSWYFSHGNPIPECHNIIVGEALEDDHDYLWLVEDDQQLPHGILKQLVDADADVAVADYPVRGNKHSVTYIGGVLQYAGLGCVLVKPEVFEHLTEPYFSTERGYAVSEEGLTQTEPMGNHGLHDVDWWQRVLELPFDVKVIEMTAGHYYLKKPQLPKFGNDTALEYEVQTWTL